ncbi:hypothetical protein CHF27_009070 [Romboutsia maritimum]|uniref:DUF2142 domain-containing protein n=1 Tax=Romboutsia maritimum TaxID=2020948 RepID=A0A371IS44_9FIRM|nr:hypothetical protein [Romboutsia maritimum]RDY23285.1 hypothetical protein CHF27_009070 [Romboutsia maritimum]
MKQNSNVLKFTKKSFNLFIIYVLLIATFLTTMSISYSIPNKRIRWHVGESLEQFQTEGIYPRVLSTSVANQLDNFTDAWMLNLALAADNNSPIKSALENPHTIVGRPGENDKIQNLEKSITMPGHTTKESYSRYWHGYLTILRPLLLFFSYSEIRFINTCVLFLLFMTVSYLLKKKLDLKIMLSFFLSMMLVMFSIVPLSLQFSSMFYVMFIAMITVLLLYEKIDENKLSVYLFFIIGSVASFLDLLTVPLITLGIPLTTYILLIQKSKKNKLRSGMSNLLEIIKSSIIWALGYGIVWASKWVIASLVLKQNVIKDAISQILVRTSATGSKEVLTTMDVIKFNWELIFNDFTMKIFVVILVIWVVMMILFRKDIEMIIKCLPILLIGLMPFVWYAVLKNHSQLHCWFTYRNLSVTVFSIISFMMYSIDEEKIKNIIGGKHWNI